MLHRLVPSLAGLVLCVGLSAHAAANGAEDFIRQMGDRAVATVNAPNLGDSARAKRFGSIFRDAFAVPVIGRFVLGQYWRRATDAERKEYLKLFEDYVVQTYTNRFSGYRGVKFKVGSARAVNDQEQLVPSEIVRPAGQPPVEVQWRVKQGSGYKVVDVIAEGVSMLISQRDEFASIINRSGGKVSGLIDVLRQRTGHG